MEEYAELTLQSRVRPRYVGSVLERGEWTFTERQSVTDCNRHFIVEEGIR